MELDHDRFWGKIPVKDKGRKPGEEKEPTDAGLAALQVRRRKGSQGENHLSLQCKSQKGLASLSEGEFLSQDCQSEESRVLQAWAQCANTLAGLRPGWEQAGEV